MKDKDIRFSDYAKFFTTDWKDFPDWLKLKKEYFAKLHNNKINDDPFLPNNKLPKICLDWQKTAVNRMASIMFGKNVKRIYDTHNNAKEKEAADLIEAVFKMIRFDMINTQRAKSYYAACEVATLFSLRKQDCVIAGRKSPYKVRAQILSPMDGFNLYPSFDADGDMTAFALSSMSSFVCKQIGFKAKVLTGQESVIFHDFDKSGERIPNLLGKIPVVYMHRHFPVWENSSDLVYESERTISRMSHYIRKNAKPILLIKVGDKVFIGDYDDKWSQFSASPDGVYSADELQKFNEAKQAAEQAQRRKEQQQENFASRDILTMPTDGDARFLTWQAETTATKLLLDILKENFWNSIQLPDISMDNLKSVPMSGESRKLLFIDMQMKAAAEREPWLEAFDREANIIRNIIASCIAPDLKDELLNVGIHFIIQPFLFANEVENVNVLATAVSAGFCSKETAVKRLNFVDDVDHELQAINADDLANNL